MAALPQVLNTPLAIYQAAREDFPSANIKVASIDPIAVEVILGQGVPLFSLSSAVNRLALSVALKTQAQNRGFASHTGQAYTPVPLVPSRFSSGEPLTGWQGFARFIYEQGEQRCENALKAYLQNPDEPALELLTKLGLAPDQMGRAPTKEEAAYFRKATEGLGPEDAAMSNLRTEYPRVVQYLLEENRQKQIENLRHPAEDTTSEMLTRLQSRVIGQPLATKQMATLLSKNRSDENQVFLFVGPTGTGKTELAKAVANEKGQRIVIINMENFKSEHSVGTFFGADASFVGSISPPQMALALEKYPAAVTRVSASERTVNGLVLLFDEFERGHPELRESFFTLFRDGYCVVRYTDGRNGPNVTVKYTLKNCVMICTSNLCENIILGAFRRGGLSTDEIVELFKIGNRALQPHPRSFTDALIGRMQTIPFGPIPHGEDYQRILNGILMKFLGNIKKDLRFKDVQMGPLPVLLPALEGRVYGEGTNIPGIDRYLKEKIEDLIYQNKRHWGGTEDKRLRLTAEAGQIRLQVWTYDKFAEGGYRLTPGEASVLTIA